MPTLSAIEVAAEVRAGRRTARKVVDGALGRIAADDARIGAFQLVDADGARRAADALAERGDLTDLPLAGVPVAIKDNIAVAGLPTRHGSGATSAEPAPADDELVRRLREAGAIVVGKTRLPELAIWGFTESLTQGGTRNPRDPSRNAGGSTGGGAAAVAAGLVPLALGSDGGGSLRIPAAHCGVVGLKPATGTVPLAGGLAEHWFGCSAYGPLANTVDDVALAVDILAGSTGWRGTADAARPLRVAVSLRSPSPIGSPDSTAKESLQAAEERARAAGHDVTTAHPPYPRLLANTWMACWFAGIAEEVERLALPAERLEPRTRWMAARGARLRQHGKPDRAPIEAWRQQASAWFEAYDVLVTPVVARPAPRYGWAKRASFVRAYLNGARGTPYTQAWNVAGFPALSLPLGGTPTAPGAVQVITTPGREALLLALASQLST